MENELHELRMVLDAKIIALTGFVGDDVLRSLKLARMWMGKLLESITEENPYPNSMMAENDIIDPPTDKDQKPLPHTERNVIELIKRHRIDLHLMIDKVRDDFFSPENFYSIDYRWTVIIIHLTEAKMWLGVELERIAEAERKISNVLLPGNEDER